MSSRVPTRRALAGPHKFCPRARASRACGGTSWPSTDRRTFVKQVRNSPASSLSLTVSVPPRLRGLMSAPPHVLPGFGGLMPEMGHEEGGEEPSLGALEQLHAAVQAHLQRVIMPAFLLSREYAACVMKAAHTCTWRHHQAVPCMQMEAPSGSAMHANGGTIRQCHQSPMSLHRVFISPSHSGSIAYFIATSQADAIWRDRSLPHSMCLIVACDPW